MTDSFAHEISQQVAHLTPGQQHDVLQFVKQLRSRTSKEKRNRIFDELAGSISPEDIAIMKSAIEKRTPGKELLKFAGSIPHEDLEAMKSAIEEGCGQVDPDGW